MVTTALRRLSKSGGASSQEMGASVFRRPLLYSLKGVVMRPFFVQCLPLVACVLLGCGPKTSAERASVTPPAPPPTPIFEADLSSATSNCAVVNYKGRTPVSFGSVDGCPRMMFAGTLPDVKKPEPDTAWGIRTKHFPVTPGRDFAVLVEMAGDLPIAGPIPGLRLLWLDAKGKDLKVQDALGRDVAFVDTIKMPMPRQDGGAVRAYTRGHVPPGAAKAWMEIVVDWPNLLNGSKVEIRRVAYFEGKGDGSVLLGDIEPPVLELLNKSPSRNFTEPLRFRILDENGVNWSETEVRIDGEKVAVSDLKQDGDIRLYMPKTPWKADSIHRVEVLAADCRGNVGYDCGFVAFTEKTPRHPACAVRDDGMLTVDGKPVFPLGWCRVRPCRGNGFDLERGIAEMTANGMNAAHTYMRHTGAGGRGDARFDELVAACEKHGLLLYAEPSDRKPRGKTFMPLMETNLFRGLGYRLPLVWGIGDDTTRHVSTDELKYSHRCCKAVDPTALTASADVARPGGQTPYVPYADLLFVETYPVRAEQPEDDEMARPASSLDNAWESTRVADVRGRSVLALPQVFKGWNLWKRLPTMDEIRCQTYVCLACRARGVVYYASCGEAGPLDPPAPGKPFPEQKNFAPLDMPEMKTAFFALMREVGALVPSLVLRDAKQQPVVTVTKGPARNTMGGPAVRCLLKEDGLLILANTAPTNLTASIRLPSGKALVRELPRFAGFAERTSP